MAITDRFTDAELLAGLGAWQGWTPEECLAHLATLTPEQIERQAVQVALYLTAPERTREIEELALLGIRLV